MRATEFIVEYKQSPAQELAHTLPKLDDTDYDTIDRAMKKIAREHDITPKKLHDLFVDHYNKTPDSWIKSRKSMKEDIDVDRHQDQKQIILDFVKWARKVLKIKTMPRMIFSYDHNEASQEHHTGRYNPESKELWIYMGPKTSPRLSVDILRTVFHELTHVWQHEHDHIKPNSSYPGSPIEKHADIMAGKYMKIYGKDHPEIFL